MSILPHRSFLEIYLQALDEQIARRTDRGLLFIVAGLVGLIVAGGLIGRTITTAKRESRSLQR
jgi:hypothetical protein